MNGKIVFALLLVALAASVECKKAVPKAKKSAPAPTSADVEALLDPTVSSLPKGQHKLVFKGASGQEQCVVCQPFQGCGCRDVVAIRCELKRLKQKLLRLKRIAAPHKRSHHGRKTGKKPVVQTKNAVKITVKKPVDKKPADKATPKKTVKVSVKKTADKKKPTTKKAVKKPAVKKPKIAVEVKPAVLPAVQPAVKVAVKKPVVKKVKPITVAIKKPAVVKPKVDVKVQPAVLPTVKLAVQPAPKVEVKPAVQPAVVQPKLAVAVQPAVIPAVKLAVEPKVEAKPLIQPLIAPKVVVAAKPVEVKTTTLVKEAPKPAIAVAAVV